MSTKQRINRWNAVCGESRMHGVERGKGLKPLSIIRIRLGLTYRYKEKATP